MRSEIRYAKSGDVSIAYRIEGEGALDLLSIPGFVSHLEILSEDARASRLPDRIASFTRLIMFDRRGMGLSDRDAGLSTVEATIDDMRAVLDAAQSDRPALMGISEGATSAVLFAATYPERVSALILVGAFARIVRGPDYPIGLPDSVLERNFRAMEEHWGEPVGIEFFAPSAAHDPTLRNMWARMLRTGTSPSGARRLLELYRSIDIRHVLPLVSAPTLVLHVAGDKAIPVALGRYIAERIPNATLIELPGDDHFIQWTDPDRVADEIEQFLTGKRPAPVFDRVLATVLFTDIVASTERAAELGDDAWRRMLGRHNEIVRDHLLRFRGKEVKTTGDGFLATFDGPARAVRAAVAIEEAVRGLGLEIRAGLHTGECEIIGDDVGGIAVHIAARVATAANPGEVLASSTVRDLVVGSGIEFEDRGAHALKGVPGEWRLLSVVR